jgi:Queuosine salvage protein
MGEAVPEQVRAACAWVAERARFVRIDREALAQYALGPADAAGDTAFHPQSFVQGTRGGRRSEDRVRAENGSFADDGRERRAALVICQDAINFGSGWWPTIRKREGHSGYSTIAAGIADRFRDSPWSARDLIECSARSVGQVLGQDAEHPLMGLYADALRDVGEHLLRDHRGRFSNLLDAAGGSAIALVDRLAGWRAFADVSTYEGRAVPFFKRAQIAAADVSRAGLAELACVERLTAFADNLVPHVLRVDGVLRLAPDLLERIDSGALLRHDSAEEVELRACAVHAVELLASATGGRLCPAQVDEILWHRGRAPRYKAVERSRCRTTAY